MSSFYSPHSSTKKNDAKHIFFWAGHGYVEAECWLTSARQPAVLSVSVRRGRSRKWRSVSRIARASMSGCFCVELQNRKKNNSQWGCSEGSCNHKLWQGSSVMLHHLSGFHHLLVRVVRHWEVPTCRINTRKYYNLVIKTARLTESWWNQRELTAKIRPACSCEIKSCLKLN